MMLPTVTDVTPTRTFRSDRACGNAAEAKISERMKPKAARLPNLLIPFLVKIVEQKAAYGWACQRAL
jgi:hypothetical protein